MSDEAFWLKQTRRKGCLVRRGQRERIGNRRNKKNNTRAKIKPSFILTSVVVFTFEWPRLGFTGLGVEEVGWANTDFRAVLKLKCVYAWRNTEHDYTLHVYNSTWKMRKDEHNAGLDTNLEMTLMKEIAWPWLTGSRIYFKLVAVLQVSHPPAPWF